MQFRVQLERVVGIHKHLQTGLLQDGGKLEVLVELIDPTRLLPDLEPLMNKNNDGDTF